MPAADRIEPHTAAVRLVRANALDQVSHHHRGGTDLPPANWTMYRELTAALESWQAAGTLPEDSLALTEWLAVELTAYILLQLDQDHARLHRWLLDHGEGVRQAQQHQHPAGPTTVEILSAVAADAAARSDQPAAAERLVRIAVPYLSYLRPGREVEDAREVALTLGQWAGANLAGLTVFGGDRVHAYLNHRAAARNAHPQLPTDGSRP
ncbi:hypothetical protein [Kitasatospora sp. NPDC087315]|uniref:hypothetical protein n=1 Tax=Kitasatospora sp. NPDC087315 TaxID=3364069 RepID=UPI0037F4060C